MLRCSTLNSRDLLKGEKGKRPMTKGAFGERPRVQQVLRLRKNMLVKGVDGSCHSWEIFAHKRDVRCLQILLMVTATLSALMKLLNDSRKKSLRLHACLHLLFYLMFFFFCFFPLYKNFDVAFIACEWFDFALVWVDCMRRKNDEAFKENLLHLSLFPRVPQTEICIAHSKQNHVMRSSLTCAPEQ